MVWSDLVLDVGDVLHKVHVVTKVVTHNPTKNILGHVVPVNWAR